MKEVAVKIAEVRGIEPQEVAARTTENFRALFRTEIPHLNPCFGPVADNGREQEAWRMAAENSFDIVSKVDLQEVRNAIDQATKEVRTRFDLKDSKSEINLEGEDAIQLASVDEYKLQAVAEILRLKLVKRGVSLKALTFGKVEPAAGSSVRQKIDLQQGIAGEKAKEIVRIIKDSKKKVQASIQGDSVRVSGRDRDALQEVIALLKGRDLGIDMQFTNYRSG